jgi:hypothetical protein
MRLAPYDFEFYKEDILEQVPSSYQEAVEQFKKQSTRTLAKSSTFSVWEYKELVVRNVYSDVLYGLRQDISYSHTSCQHWGVVVFGTGGGLIDFINQYKGAYERWVMLCLTV